MSYKKRQESKTRATSVSDMCVWNMLFSCVETALGVKMEVKVMLWTSFGSFIVVHIGTKSHIKKVCWCVC